ncbi:probable ubiquitin-like-specific protease 2B isoform X1 [Helianthus annuus]|uniref:Putative ulp1 protease family, C-terminal catalytic domain-containing protein n=1 Tax=Helianthus annuus TaxID=4232 RepID=A0A251S9Q3_HELAN|nr:probable ubiquitin-like-specific protease 2B isoform X1 [Helianthus annuus]
MRIYSRKMKTVCNKNLDVFDFKPDDPPRNAIEKYTFLETAASGKSISAEEINYVPSLDIDTINMNHMATTLVENPSVGMTAVTNHAFKVVKQRPLSSIELRTDLSESEVNAAATSASPSNNRLKSAMLDLLPSHYELDEAGGTGTDANGSMCDRSSSSSDVADDDAGPSSDNCIDDWEMDSEDTTTVVLYPDHVIYRGSYYTDCSISFTSGFVELEGSEVDGDERTLKCKWGIEDLLHITSHWYERVEMAMVKIHVLTKDTKHDKIVECASGTELKFAVIDSSWHERLEAIVSLNKTYKALWTSMLESEDTVVGHSGVSSSKYIPVFDRPFEEVVYPKGDADPVSLSKRDFDLLQPDTFVNDTIIDFYIKYLKNKIKPDESRKLHFFNSFFFRKLADPDKDPLDASKGGVAYQRVKKWTRKVNLFEKDYVFIPINYNYHWSLIVMCHLGEVATYEDEDVNESMNVPCVLHMDSLRGSHTGLQGLVQSYLKEEWKARQHEVSEDIASRFDNLRFISLELPQQQNMFDCGLFLLHYVELFLEQAPLHFNPFKISKSFNFLNEDWFPPAEASLKRVVIQKLICDLLENPNQEPSLSTADDDQRCHVSSLDTNAHKDTVVNLSLTHHQSSHDHKKTEIPSSSIQCADDDPNVTVKPSFSLKFNCATTFDECGSQDGSARDQETINNNHESLPEIQILGCDVSVEVVNGSRQLDSETDQPTLMDIMMPGSSFGFLDMQIDGSENASGLESDVQHATKKMRMTQPIVL